MRAETVPDDRGNRKERPRRFMAFDLGAESGRAVLGRFEDGRLAIEELHRFPNEILTLNGRLHWNIYGLLSEIKKALSICASDATPDIDG
ncbi:MAG: hypothetical protein MUQ00_08600, partial [Candidatus Aminicenantes bacterium]|nr:hypothetical protein [Candidatus Aminicenantes bacterium]